MGLDLDTLKHIYVIFIYFLTNIYKDTSHPCLFVFVDWCSLNLSFGFVKSDMNVKSSRAKLSLYYRIPLTGTFWSDRSLLNQNWIYPPAAPLQRIREEMLDVQVRACKKGTSAVFTQIYLLQSSLRKRGWCKPAAFLQLRWENGRFINYKLNWGLAELAVNMWISHISWMRWPWARHLQCPLHHKQAIRGCSP